jgi:hypothetical protein
MRFDDLTDPERDSQHHWVLVTDQGVELQRFDTREAAETALTEERQHEENEFPGPMRVGLRIEERNAPRVSG